METCNTQSAENEIICSVCDYPILGTKQEQVKFRARQITLKSDVKYSLMRVKSARIILFIIGGFYSLITYYFYDVLSLIPILLYINIGLSVFFIGCAFLSIKAPKVAITTPFALILAYYTIMTLLDSSYIFQGGLIGFSLKSFILIGLGYACFSVWKAEMILSKNPYLASEMGFNKTKKNDNNLLDD